MRALLFTFALMGGEHALADCAGAQLWAYPEGIVLAQGQALLVEGYFIDHEIFMAHMRSGKAYLRTGDARVALRFVTGHKGQLHLSQVMFLPTSPLEVGRTYTLYIDDLPESLPQPARWDVKQAVWRPITWTIAPQAGDRAIAVAREAKITRSTRVHYGCGPATYVYVALGSAIPNGTWCEVRSENDDGKTINYILPVVDGLVAIGHGMCSGAFALTPGERYTAELAMLRSDGQVLPESKRSVSFVGPTEETTEE